MFKGGEIIEFVLKNENSMKVPPVTFASNIQQESNSYWT